MSNADLFNNPKYSDLTIKLSDDREIRLHKVIVCSKNAYFNKLCGEDSQFAERKQNLVYLREDDPDAVEQVLRHLYGFSLPLACDKPWRFGSNLVTAADKYLEPALSDSASSCLMEAAEIQSNPDTVFDIIQDIKNSIAHHEPLLDFAEQLRVKHLKDLLKNVRYRDLLVSDPERMLAQLDELEVPRELSEKTYFTCYSCASGLFHTPGRSQQRACISCKSTHKVLCCHTVYLPSK